MSRNNFFLLMMRAMAAEDDERYEKSDEEKAKSMQFARKQLQRATGEDFEYDLSSWHEFLTTFNQPPRISILVAPEDTVSGSYSALEEEFPGVHQSILDHADTPERERVVRMARTTNFFPDEPNM
ncbi:MAG: hypothetical protein ACE37I_12130 [Rubinisphaera brasiliensis]|uniref:hypothetical protein n=1 Tax=Rubinisphaera brasiliensis TaxID=119 RepID=UPI00391D2859